MRNRFGILVLSCLGAFGLQAADTPLAQGERDFAMSSMWATRKFFLDSIAGLSKKQWNFKPAPDRWSIAECAEHIALSEDMLAGAGKAALKTPAEPDKAMRGAKGRAADQKLLDAVADRSKKAKAPEQLQPQSKFKTAQEAVAHFQKSRGANIEYIATTQDDLRGHLSNGPVGAMDSYQWFLTMSAHTERHTKQILEVKADAKYPKK
jgi:uncharacterized damage-inducible protein DinB